MSATGQTLAERMSRWDTLISNLEPALADLPHLTGEAAQLKTMIDQVRDLAHRQDALRAQAQENTAALNALALQADKLRYRIGAGIRSKLGFTSDLLLGFGFRPRRPPGRRKKTETGVEAAGQTASEP